MHMNFIFLHDIILYVDLSIKRVKIVMEKRDEDLCVDPNFRGAQVRFLKHIPQPNHLHTYVNFVTLLNS